MTQEEIFDLARESDLGFLLGDSWLMHFEIEAFAKLVAEKEREACAKVCEDLVPVYLKDGERWLKGQNGNSDKRLKDIAPNLENAWEAEQLLKNGSVIEFVTEAHKCAKAIRARGQA